MAEPIRFHFDPLCPWCYQTSRWVRRLAELGEVSIEWGVFSLEVQNFDKPIEDFEYDRARAFPALRTAVAVRDGDGQDACGKFYAALGIRYFDGLQELSERATVEGALADAGLDVGWYERALGDASTLETVRKEHHSLVDDTRSFGVPTIRLDGGTGPAIFGPVISNPPSDDADAVELWRHISWLVRYENFSELKRDRTIEVDLPYMRKMAAERTKG